MRVHPGGMNDDASAKDDDVRISMVPRPGCPKRMVFGPCGGVRSNGGCEMLPTPCVFDAAVPWPEVRPPAVATMPADPAVPTAHTMSMTPPLVLTDLSVPPADSATLGIAARILSTACDAVLVGDHQDRPDFSPTLLAQLLRDAGTTPWVTLACRDRNRVVLEQELRSLRHDGSATVLCVTGDGRAFDVRSEVTQVFDLDGTRLAALAAAVGVPAAVAETPTAPPQSARPRRLVEKQRAGAGIAVLNHVSSASDVAAFMTAARVAGLTIPVMASVTVYTDARSAAVLAALPGLALDPAAVGAVVNASDPVAAGMERAIEEAARLLAIEGIVGVNLSGMASARGPLFAAEVQADIGRAIRQTVARSAAS